LNPKGLWRQDIAYARNDLITYQDAAYICVLTHSPSQFNPDQWQLLMKFNQEVKHEDIK
jgi:spore germination cell wall hydrolase CwlJ-like protein